MDRIPCGQLAGVCVLFEHQGRRVNHSFPTLHMSTSSPITRSSTMDSRMDWRRGVVIVIRDAFRGVLDYVSDNDIDWDAWRPLYEQGLSPQAAVDRPFLRNL